jgi:hypothetical protein
MTEEKKRPGWVTFAGIIMIVVGMFSLTSAIAGFSSASWLDQFNVDIGGNLTLSAVVDLVLAFGYFFAAYSIFKGSKFGYYWAIVFAVVNATKWFFVIFWFPIPALTAIALDALVIYALANNPKWFGFNWLGV